jgi:hypothetical protein
MRDQERLTRPVLVSLPAEIDMGNAEHVREWLRAAFAPSVTAVIPEMGMTVFCHTTGSHQLVAAHKRAMSWFANLEFKSCEAGSGGPLSSQPPSCAGCRPMRLLRDRGF